MYKLYFIEQRWLFVRISHHAKKIPVPGIKNPRDISRIKNPEEIPGFWDFRDFQISIPIPRISGFFNLAQNKKSGFGIPKNSHPEAKSAH